MPEIVNGVEVDDIQLTDMHYTMPKEVIEEINKKVHELYEHIHELLKELYAVAGVYDVPCACFVQLSNDSEGHFTGSGFCSGSKERVSILMQLFACCHALLFGFDGEGTHLTRDALQEFACQVGAWMAVYYPNETEESKDESDTGKGTPVQPEAAGQTDSCD